jgi:hypothetical protein
MKKWFFILLVLIIDCIKSENIEEGILLQAKNVLNCFYRNEYPNNTLIGTDEYKTLIIYNDLKEVKNIEQLNEIKIRCYALYVENIRFLTYIDDEIPDYIEIYGTLEDIIKGLVELPPINTIEKYETSFMKRMNIVMPNLKNENDYYE